MGRGVVIFLGIVGTACAFDASGVPTASDDGTGIASSEDSGSTSTSSSTSATTAGSGSASATTRDDSAVDSSTTDPLTDPATTTNEGDASTSGATEATAGTSSGGSSSGGPEPICGNGMIESPETCETGDLGTFACSDLGAGYGGTPSCAGCQIDDGPCCMQSGVVCVPALNDCCNGCGLDFVCD